MCWVFVGRSSSVRKRPMIAIMSISSTRIGKEWNRHSNSSVKRGHSGTKRISSVSHKNRKSIVFYGNLAIGSGYSAIIVYDNQFHNPYTRRFKIEVIQTTSSRCLLLSSSTICKCPIIGKRRSETSSRKSGKIVDGFLDIWENSNFIRLRTIILFLVENLYGRGKIRRCHAIFYLTHIDGEYL